MAIIAWLRLLLLTPIARKRDNHSSQNLGPHRMKVQISNSTIREGRASCHKREFVAGGANPSYLIRW
jgi:hypothetical protein